MHLLSRNLFIVLSLGLETQFGTSCTNGFVIGFTAPIALIVQALTLIRLEYMGYGNSSFINCLSKFALHLSGK